MRSIKEMIGAQVSLMTKSHIRYEGTLEDMDMEKSVIVLKNVKVQGTEDRVEDEIRKVYPSDRRFEHISFRGAGIACIDIISDDCGEPVDPAIISVEGYIPPEKGNGSYRDTYSNNKTPRRKYKGDKNYDMSGSNELFDIQRSNELFVKQDPSEWDMPMHKEEFYDKKKSFFDKITYDRRGSFKKDKNKESS